MNFEGVPMESQGKSELPPELPDEEIREKLLFPHLKPIMELLEKEFDRTGFLMGIGYFFGNFYIIMNKDLRWMFVIAMIVIATAAIYEFGKAMKKRFSKSEP